MIVSEFEVDDPGEWLDMFIELEAKLKEIENEWNIKTYMVHDKYKIIIEIDSKENDQEKLL